MLITLVWLAGRYEATQVQDQLEHDTAQAVALIRSTLGRNLLDLQALQPLSTHDGPWHLRAAALLQMRSEILKLDLRAPDMTLLQRLQTPYRSGLSSTDTHSVSDTALHHPTIAACASAQRMSTPSYSASYFEFLGGASGTEVMEVCVPLGTGATPEGFVVATYALRNILAILADTKLAHSQEVSFTEPDGTRLAIIGAAWRGSHIFTARQLLDLPGNTLVLRIDSWHRAPSLFPNVLTALVTAMSIALVSVLIVLVRDNRRRLRAERDLGDALAFRKAMEDSLVTGLRARDLQGRISYVNPAFCAMVGFNAEELLGQNFAPFWPPELAEEYVRRQAQRLSGATPPAREGHESVFMRKDGTRFPVLIFEAPLINAQGLHTGWMSAFIDITEQRRMEELSRASQERLQATARLATVGEMASMLSHELTQPLVAISSYANGSLNMLANHDPESMNEHLLPNHLRDMHTAMQRIAFQADRAGKVIKSVRDFVRRRSQTHETVRPIELMEAVMPLIRMQASKLGVKVSTHIPAHLPSVVCDPTMIEQVMLNLARNGMQAMENTDISHRALTIEAASIAAQSKVQFSVADQGCGITQDVAQMLCTPFFTTREEGMGLGLSLCRTVVEQHGGELHHTAHSPQGTVFYFSLPTVHTRMATP